MKFPNQLKRITGDFVINILASVIYTFARQIVVFPLLASRLSDADYGTLLTVVGLANVCISLVGNSLNNIRLIQNSRYEDQGLCGDFLRLCTAGLAVSAVFSMVMWRVFDYAVSTALGLTAFILVSILYNYSTAFFRLELNFKRILMANVLVSCAYIAATFLFATKELWPFIFLVGESVGLIYTAIVTPCFREPRDKTPLFGETSKRLLELMAAALVTNLLMYADRMILYPVLGANSVSYYSTASFFGKSAGIVMTPIAGVLLGHFSQKGFTASKKLFTLVNGSCLACLAVFLLGCHFFAPWFTKLLYPTLFEGAAPYISLANFSSSISIASNMAQPMILKCCSTKWLVIIQWLFAVVYLVSSMVLIPMYGLLGFCWASILSNSVHLLSLYALGYWKF